MLLPWNGDGSWASPSRRRGPRDQSTVQLNHHRVGPEWSAGRLFREGVSHFWQVLHLKMTSKSTGGSEMTALTGHSVHGFRRPADPRCARCTLWEGVGMVPTVLATTQIGGSASDQVGRLPYVWSGRSAHKYVTQSLCIWLTTEDQHITRRIEVVVIGGGQAGLAISHYLTQQGRDHVVLEQAMRSAVPGVTDVGIPSPWSHPTGRFGCRASPIAGTIPTAS